MSMTTDVTTQVTSFSHTIPTNSGLDVACIFTPAGTLAAGTVIMPASPNHGAIVSLLSTQIITALTHSANTNQTLVGAATTLAANVSGGRWVYNAPNATWYPT